MDSRATLPRRTAIIISLLASGMAAQPPTARGADAQAAAAGSEAEPARQISYASKLRANATNIKRYVVGGICEQQGIRQISQILKRSDFEEMWAFLPHAHGTQQCQWHEIGRKEESESDAAHLRVDMRYLEKLMAENAELYVYHFHPLKYFECASHADCPRTATPGKSDSFDPRWITDLVFSMPSPSDVHFMMDVTARFYRRHQTLAMIKHKVVTPYGVVAYGLTQEGLAKFEAERFGRSEGLYITWLTASRLADDHVEEVIRDRPGSIGSAVQRLAQTLNNRFLQVTHGTVEQ